jgi:hypothetical protein
MGIVEGEPDHTGLSAWAWLLRWLRRRPRRKLDPGRDRMAQTPDPPDRKDTSRGGALASRGVILRNRGSSSAVPRKLSTWHEILGRR